MPIFIVTLWLNLKF